VLTEAPLVALCVRLQEVEKVSVFSLLHCLIKSSGIESSNVYVWLVSFNAIIFTDS